MPKPCDSCGARNPSKNGHWWGCKRGKNKDGNRK